MPKNEKLPLYVFIDESGNLDFSGNGTDHFVMSAFITSSPAECSQNVVNLKYEFMRRGLDAQLPFHAVYNSRGTRQRFSEALCGSTHRCRVHSIYCDKHYAHQSKHSPEVFYSLVAGALAKYIVKSFRDYHSPIVLMFDSALSKKHRAAFLKVIKPQLAALGVEYRISFATIKEEPCGQIADYFAWALFRQLESNDPVPLSQLPVSHSKFNIFQYGHTRYW